MEGGRESGSQRCTALSIGLRLLSPYALRTCSQVRVRRGEFQQVLHVTVTPPLPSPTTRRLREVGWSEEQSGSVWTAPLW